MGHLEIKQSIGLCNILNIWIAEHFEYFHVMLGMMGKCLILDDIVNM